MRSNSFGAAKGLRRGGRQLDEPLLIESTAPPHGRRIQIKATLCLAVWLSAVTAFAGCSGCSRRAEIPVVLSSSTTDGLCGSRDDGLVHVPPRFNDFTPPGKGESYTDPQYGCTVVRLTDAKSQFNLAVPHQYSTISAVNQDDTRVMLITEWGQGAIVDVAGDVVVAPRDFPGTNAGNMPWARHPAEAFYYTNGNTLYRGSISGQAVKSTRLHAFVRYHSVMIPGQEHLSEDGDHLWMVGGSQAFLYTISTNTTGPRVDIGAKDAGCGWHKIQIAPSNKLVTTS